MESCSFALGECVLSEFEDAELSDERLGRRLEQIVRAVQARPDVGFPQAMTTRAELEGFYRFIENDRFDAEDLMEPHVQATLGRLENMKTALCLHDTTKFRFGGNRKGLGRTRSGSGPRAGQGFFSHYSLAVSADGQAVPLGVLAANSWVRKNDTRTRRRAKGASYDEVRKLPSEQDRWVKSVREVEELTADTTSLVHVMDSEADDFALLADLNSDRARFVVRLCYDRVLHDATSDVRTVKQFVESMQSVHTRTVTLSSRRPSSGNPRKRIGARKARQATLSFSAATATLRRPNTASKHHPVALSVNVVRVWEESPPKDAEPVEWLLLTSEPIRTRRQMLRVVDYYRARWLIEEYFKALKTGCAFEKRQLESYDTLVKALALFTPIAWSLLRLRTLSRQNADGPATRVLSRLQIKILRTVSEYNLPGRPSIGDVTRAIARMGGHLRSNGPPGWQTLGRGFSDLLMLERGVRLGAKM